MYTKEFLQAKKGTSTGESKRFKYNLLLLKVNKKNLNLCFKLQQWRIENSIFFLLGEFLFFGFVSFKLIYQCKRVLSMRY